MVHTCPAANNGKALIKAKGDAAPGQEMTGKICKDIKAIKPKNSFQYCWYKVVVELQKIERSRDARLQKMAEQTAAIKPENPSPSDADHGVQWASVKT